MRSGANKDLVTLPALPLAPPPCRAACLLGFYCFAGGTSYPGPNFLFTLALGCELGARFSVDHCMRGRRASRSPSEAHGVSGPYLAQVRLRLTAVNASSTT